MNKHLTDNATVNILYGEQIEGQKTMTRHGRGSISKKLSLSILKNNEAKSKAKEEKYLIIIV